MADTYTHETDRNDVTCLGCGVPIQSEHPRRAGFLPKSVVDKLEQVVCQRCYKLSHYNEIVPLEFEENDYRDILHHVGTERALVVYVVDIFDLSGTWISGLKRFIGHNPVLLVANKIDVLPEKVKLGRVREWLQQEAKADGIRPVDIVFSSGKSGTGMDEVVDAMTAYAEGRDIYIVGVTNVGKSTLINSLITRYGEDNGQPLVTESRLPGTTLGFIQIPLENGQVLYDTPGLKNDKQISHLLSETELRQVMPNKRMKPRVYQLMERQTLFLGGLVRFDYREGPRQAFVCYVANDVPIHRTKLEKAFELYERHVGQMLSPPNKENVAHFPPMQRHDFHLKQPSDVVISGLGWVAVKGETTHISVYAPKNIPITLRSTLI